MPVSPMKYKMPMSGDPPPSESMDDPAPVEAEEKAPPNLRDVMSEAPICGTCKHFAGASCSKYNGYPCKYHEGCDEHSDLEAESPEGSDMEAPEPVDVE
jgi:hypothetical protein